MTIVLIPALLVYGGLIYWFINRLYLPKYYARVIDTGSSGSTYRLAGTVRCILSILHGLLLLAAIAWPAVWVVMSLSQAGHALWGANVGVFSGFRLDLNLLPALEASGLRNQTISGKTLLNIDTHSHFAWQLFALSTYIKALVGLYVVLQLRNIFVSLSNGEIFAGINSMRLKKIAAAILAWQAVLPLIEYFGWGVVLKQISFSTQAIQLYPAFELNAIGVFTGLALLVLSGVMNEAVQMRDEQRLTI
jgi:hypothetical protein